MSIQPKAPPAVYTQTVRYIDGRCGDALDKAREAIRKKATELEREVERYTQTPAKVVEWVEENVGTDAQGQPRKVKKRLVEISVTGHLRPVGAQRWVRLTTAAGPAAVELLTTEDGKVTKRETLHPEDHRGVALNYAIRALGDGP